MNNRWFGGLFSKQLRLETIGLRWETEGSLYATTVHNLYKYKRNSLCIFWWVKYLHRNTTTFKEGKQGQQLGFFPLLPLIIYNRLGKINAMTGLVNRKELKILKNKSPIPPPAAGQINSKSHFKPFFKNYWTCAC